MEKQNNCKDCRFFNRLADDSKHGLCLNVDVMISEDDIGIEIHDKNLTAGMILVGQHFGCIHFECEQKKV
jgi:hypothetical protein